MTQTSISKGYEPDQVEQKWTDFWLESKSFTPDLKEARFAYSIVIPPPNVTGTLHMGHALNITLQDILCRYKRQRGYQVLWVPGTDHAGIATQNVVEKALAQEGVSRQDLGREKFVGQVWEWKQEYGDKILNQISGLGASVDWTRLRFTMDNGLSRAVREVFVSLYEQGYIYQGDYIINWCPRCQTALADLEVEYEEHQGGLYHIRYPLVDNDQAVIVATTRPETMLGDTAVAVHPQDERYQHLIGKSVLLPLTNRQIPVVADPYVDQEFGTGCLKITPCHDPNDFELGQRYNLEQVKVIDEQGFMTEAAGTEYSGLDRFACRKKVIQDLQEQDFLDQQEKYPHKVGHCYRCQTIIEPLVSKQWFVATKELAQSAKDAVAKNQTDIYPGNWIKLYYEWLDNIRDWCISRQIWWGHRIPAWNCNQCGQIIVRRDDPKECTHCGSQDLTQDKDVLDTWFSSALWPFSTLGWPEKTPELSIFYPTSVLITGFDILFFWVARMMMMGLKFMGQVPFRDIYIHALVRDEQGQKMSKSTGNVIDPLLMIDRYGADALRFTLAVFAAMGRDVKLSEPRIEGYKHFINKVWNTARFVLLNLDENVPGFRPVDVQGLHQGFIFHELEVVKQKIVEALNGYRFNDAAQILYQFVWHTYCDWYLEMVKTDLADTGSQNQRIAQACLYKSFKEIIILLHPFIPFVTQEIWSYLPKIETLDLSQVSFPESRPEMIDESLPEQMDFFQEVVVSVRNIRSELNINPGQKLDLLVRANSDYASILQENHINLLQLARLNNAQIDPKIDPPQIAASSVVKGCELFVPLEGVVDFQAELQRLDKQLKKVDKELAGLESKLSNEDFIQKAPQEVVEKEKNRKQELREKRDKIGQLQEKFQQFVNH